MTYGKPPGASFPKTTLTPRRRTSALCEDIVGGDEECNRLLENIPQFDNLFTKKTKEEVQTALDSFISSLDGAHSEADVPVPTDTTGTPDVSAVFNELIGQ